MFVHHNLSSYYRANFGDKSVHYEYYNKNMLFLGENGSIDIRVYDGESFMLAFREEEPLLPKESMELLFEKAGADGRKVWD